MGWLENDLSSLDACSTACSGGVGIEMSVGDSQTSEIEALNTLLERGVISKEQFDQMHSKIKNGSGGGRDLPPPVPPHGARGKSRWQAHRLKALVLLSILILSIGVTAVVVAQNGAEKRAAAEAAARAADEAAERAAKDQAERRESLDRQASLKACDDKVKTVSAWSDFLDVSNENTDYSKAKSLSQAKEWSLTKSQAIAGFRRAVKKISHSSVSDEQRYLVETLNEIEDNEVLKAGADNWTQFNRLVTSINLLFNDLNEAKDDLFAALDLACATPGS